MSLFLLILLVLFPVLFFGVTFGGPKTIHALHSLPRICSKTILFLGGVRLKFRNPMPFDPAGQYIFISNHNSNLDPVITGGAIPNLYKFIAKAEILKMPIFGYIVRKLYVSVVRTDANDRSRSMEVMREFIDLGSCLIMYPEATRNRTDEPLGPFKSGAFNLSIEKKVPIVVLLAVDSWKRMSPTDWWVKPGVMDCVWLGPYEPGDRTHEEMEEYKAMIKGDMLRILEGSS